MIANFPLYALRSYKEIFEEGPFKIIETPKDRYILDFVGGTGTYLSRRLELMRQEDLPYRIYPINKKIASLTDLFNTKSRTFIDSTGKLVTYNPLKFYKLKCSKIIHRVTLPNGNMLIRVVGIPVQLEVPYSNDANYARIVKYKGAYVLYDLQETLVPDTRRKL